MDSFGLGDNYKNDIIEKSEVISKIYKFYEAKNNKTEQDICLKVIDKKNLQLDDDEIEIDLILNQIKQEAKILKEFDFDNIIKLYNVFDNDNYLTLEIEYFDQSLHSYMEEQSIFEKGEIYKFKKITLDLVNILKELKRKGIIHRNIKPKNILILEPQSEDDDNIEIKLANFECAIYTKDAETSQPMGTFIYLAPEIINKSKYDEKSDLWSLGITLYELYFGCLPFGQEDTIGKFRRIIEGKEKFIYRKARGDHSNNSPPNIPTLDVLFKRLLCINPEERMSLEELCDFVENENFLKEDAIYDNEKYPKYKYTEIYEEIKKEEQVEYHLEKGEGGKPLYVEKIPSIIYFLKKIDSSGVIDQTDEIFKDQKKFNNIIYFDENKEEKNEQVIFNDCQKFEENTPGCFIFCDDFNYLNLIKHDILEEINKNKDKNKEYTFNLITTGISWEEKINKLLKNDNDNDWKKIIKNVCIYCKNFDEYTKYKYLSKEFNIINCVWSAPTPVVKFIQRSSSEKTLPFPYTKLVTYEKYKEGYNIFHLMISAFYGENKKEIFETNYDKMTKLIDEEDKTGKLKNSKRWLKESFKRFDIDEEKKNMEEIITEYTNSTSFYLDMNSWLMSLNIKYYCTVAYFSSRLIYCLNYYGQKSRKYFNKDQEIYRGMTLPLISVLPYKRAVNKIILFSNFTSTSTDKERGEKFAKRGDYKEDNSTNFSVIYYIKNIHKTGWISNGVDIEEISKFKYEKEILYQAFSFYYVEKVDINYIEKTADIYLITIGKTSILEEEIKKEYSLEYNIEEKIIEIKK